MPTKLRYLLIILAVLLSSCGSMDWHVVDYPTLMQLAGNPDHPMLGWTHWDNHGGCDVYLLPEYQYPSNACYQAVVDHEERHCIEHAFHPLGKGYITECSDFQPPIEKEN